VDLDEDDCTEPFCPEGATECSTQPAPEDSDCRENGANGKCTLDGNCDLCADVTCAAPSQCQEDSSCNEDTGMCLPFENKDRGTTCTEGGGSYCDGEGTCVPCNVPEDCNDGEECTDDYCTVANMCVNAPKADGEPCSQGACLGGVCGTVFPCTEQGIRDAIAAGGGPYTFACVGPTTVVTGSEIIIDNDVILDGEGNLTVDGNDDHRVVSVVSGVTAELVRMTVSGGYLDDDLWPDSNRGAGVLNEGTLTIRDSVIERNVGRELTQGGGVYSRGTLSVLNSAVRDNSIEVGEGGGIYSEGTLTLVRSGVSYNWGGNDANWGAGIDSVGTLTLIDSYVSYNDAGDGSQLEVVGTLTVLNSAVIGAYEDAWWGIFSEGTGTIINSTVQGARDAAIYHQGGTLTIISSTVTNIESSYGLGTIAAASDAEIVVANSVIVEAESYTVGTTCNGSLVSLGGNIESPTSDCGFNQPTDMMGVTAEQLQLGPLQDNGGPTETHALLPGSVAIDWIPEAMCLEADGEPLTTDQRGEPRPVAILGPEPKCDVGAFEVQP